MNKILEGVLDFLFEKQEVQQEAKEEIRKKVYCRRCKWYRNMRYLSPACYHKEYMEHEDTWEERKEYLGDPCVLNSENNCQNYEPKELTNE